LTKNYGRYEKIINKGVITVKNNYWFGTTVTTVDGLVYARGQGINTFASIEPIMGEFKGTKAELLPDWVIVGAETGNRKSKVVPEKAWIDNIVNGCKAAGVPVFLKNNLHWPEQIQELPEGLK
jgi:protein gp37